MGLNNRDFYLIINSQLTTTGLALDFLHHEFSDD